jgi:signal transduction histidine kinase
MSCRLTRWPRFSSEAMQRLRSALWPIGLGFGVAAEWIGQPELIVLDAAAGFALVFLGLAAWSSRPNTKVGPIMVGAGFTWFLGTLWAPAVLLHRAPLAQLLLSYPTGRVSSRLARVFVGAAYAYAAAYPVAEKEYATITFAAGLVALSIGHYSIARGPERRAQLAPLSASTTFGFVLALSATARLTDVGGVDAVLFAYDLTVLLIAVGLFADLLWGRWAQAAVTGLVIDLGESGAAGTLRDRLARTLGDPTLVLAYWLPGEDRFVDEAGRTIEPPAPGAERAVTPIEEDGRQIAALVHDVAILDDPQLISAVASATGLALSNVRLQADVRERVKEVEASRRRIVEAADEQRRRLEGELRTGAEMRLAHAADLLADSGEPLAEARGALDAARSALIEFASGIRPRTLTEQGLHRAIQELAERSPFPVDAVVPHERFAPAIEAAAYFVCSEALTNAAKYANASRATVCVSTNHGRLVLDIADDGIGGADASRGSGLRGLTDRVEALGGLLELESTPGRGTRVGVSLPLTARDGRRAPSDLP